MQKRAARYNFVHFEAGLRLFLRAAAGVRPEETLDEHRDDEREHLYTRQQLEERGNPRPVLERCA